MAKIKRNDNELKLQLEKNNLYTDVENACLNYNRGKDEFAAANQIITITQNPLMLLRKNLKPDW